ncbi:MAG: hypothetical protein AB7K36_24410 [Chloroflexota bacterium]
MRPIESDVGTVLAEVDKVLRVDGPTPWLAHLELQASRDARLPVRLLQYNALLHHRHQLAVESTVVLLRPEADSPELSGQFEQHGPHGFRTITFGYHVVRLWQHPVEGLLNGSLGVLPMAPLAAVRPAEPPAILRQVARRVRQEAPPTIADELWAATFLLLGLRYDERTVREMVRRMSWLQESSTYQAILAEGREEGREEGRAEIARRFVLDLGTETFGAPDQATVAALQEISDLTTLERLHRRILTATNWAELLA